MTNEEINEGCAFLDKALAYLNKRVTERVLPFEELFVMGELQEAITKYHEYLQHENDKLEVGRLISE